MTAFVSTPPVASFEDVTVYPTQDMLKPPFMLFRGGPDWPRFWLRRRPRTCRFTPAIPFDLRPRRVGAVSVASEASGIWCGPVCQHFGHAIATFGMRLPLIARLSGDEPVVFSARPGEAPPAFFAPMLAHFGIAAARVLIVTTPTVFRRLSVVPQGERKSGGGPGAAHLDLLDTLAGPPPAPDGSRLYVSRAGMWKGKIAGELHLEKALADLGYASFRPENLPLDQQLAAYRRASHLVFAEGSALHALQLLGRVKADVTVVVRRRGTRLARAAIGARAASLGYVDAARGLVRGLDAKGRPQPSAGMTIVDDDALVAGFERLGIPLGAQWNRHAFRAQQAEDLRIWVEARRAHPLHPDEEEAIVASLRSSGLSPITGRDRAAAAPGRGIAAGHVRVDAG